MSNFIFGRGYPQSHFLLIRLVDQCHVSKSNIDVIRFVMSKIDKKKFFNGSKKDKKDFFRAIIKRHNNNFDYYVKVMTGNI